MCSRRNGSIASVGQRASRHPLAWLLAAVMLGGCATERGWPDAPGMPPEQRRSESIRLMRQAERAAEKGRELEAIDLYKQAVGASGDLYAAWNNLGELLMRQENYADAVSAYQVAADLQPQDARPLYNIGVAYVEVGWAEEALEYFKQALDRDPSYLPALRGAVKSAELLRRADDATLDLVRRGLLRETDDRWRVYFERQRFRVERLIEMEEGRG